MCGRFALTIETVLKIFHDQGLAPVKVPSRYNIAPGQNSFIFYKDKVCKKGALMRWGLIPPWAKDEKIGYTMINARSETLMEKPSFKKALINKRCVVPASGFYEWLHIKKGKIPLYFHNKNDEPLYLAGLYETWQSEDKKINSFTIITTAANEYIKKFHNRMPAILNPDDIEAWLDPAHQQALPDLKPYTKNLTEYRVSTQVNTPINDSAELIKPI